MAGLMNYLNNMKSSQGNTKAPYMPSSDDEVLMNALQKLSENQGAGDLGQGLAGFAYAMQAGKRGAEQQQQQQQQNQVYGSIFDNLSQGKVNDAIARAADYARNGGDLKNLDRIKEITNSVVKPQVTLGANGKPVFVGTAGAISNNMVSAPENRQMLSDAETARNNLVNNSIARGNLGIRGQELDLQRDRVESDKTQGKAPSGYIYQPDGSLQYIKGGPADPNVKAAAKPLPSNASKQLSDNNSAMSAIDNALNISTGTPNAFGLLGGLAGSTTLTNNLADSKNVNGRAAIADIGSKIIHDRSGAAVTMSEAPRLKPFIPSAFDSPQVIKTKLSQLRQKLSEENEGLLNTYDAQGYNISDKLKNLSTGAASQQNDPLGIR